MGYYFFIVCYNGFMTLIGMSEAGKRAKMTRPGIRRALQAAGIKLTEISAKAFAVEETDLASFLDSRPSYKGRGRPPGAKNKPKPEDRPKPEK